MRILVLCARVPAAGRKGDQVLSYYRVLHLARAHTVHVICFSHGADDLAHEEALRAMGIQVTGVPWRRGAALAAGLAACVPGGQPFQCAFYSSAQMRRTFEDTVRKFEPDALHAVTVRIVDNIRSYSGRLYVDMVDSLALNFGRRVANARGLKRVLLELERRRVATYERQVARRSQLAFVVSRLDQLEIGEPNVKVSPLGIDTNRFTKAPHPAPQPQIVFTGNMSYQPNVEAVLWFVGACWPAIRQAIPDARLVVAGRQPSAQIQALRADAGVSVTGRVESIADVLNQATLAVAPMQSGSGMQFKILEAMACGLPVVTTPLGLGDLAARPGEEILVADSPAAFVESTLRLVRSAELRSRVGDAGLAYVKSQHDWDRLNERFEVACGFR